MQEADEGGGRLVPWLEHRETDEDHPVRIPLDRSPFRIGRSPESDFVVHSSKVSKEHAELTSRRNVWTVRDLGSTNGTFVNGERLSAPRRIENGDMLHVANKGFSFHFGVQNRRDDATALGTHAGGELGAVSELVRAMSGRRIYAVFQPIVTLADRRVCAYECLGRPDLEGGHRSITELFQTADEQGRAADLSRMLRAMQIADAVQLPERELRVFVNLHPSELRDPNLVATLAPALSGMGGGRTPVIEIHENSITDLAAMGRFRAELQERGIELAYDDFGAGQSRLMELAEVPPDYIKLDLSIVRGIDASPARRDLVGALARVMRDLGIRVLAEGIETESELETCLAIGCELGQGFLFARPQRVGAWAAQARP